MQKEKQINEVKQAIANFIINATKESAPSYAVQVLPEAVKSYIELNKFVFRG